MDVEYREVDGCVIIDLFDDHFSYPKTEALKNHVSYLLQEGRSRLVLNLEGVARMDSFGLAVLVSILKRCKENNGNLTVYGLQPQVERLVEITHLDRVLEVWISEAQAVSQVKG